MFVVNIITILPKMFPGVLEYSLAGKALKKGLWSINIIDLRSFAVDKHGSVDDRPYGGGAGMIMRADVLGKAIDDVISCHPNTQLIYMSPSGVKLNQDISRQMTSFSNITILCGRFEGVDRRVVDFYNFYELSIGDYILSGGEIAAMVLLDSCVRLIPGVLNNVDSVRDESFGQDNLLEYPQYTRPAEWKGTCVPEVLLSGHHEKIREWRAEQSDFITRRNRPDLIIGNDKNGECNE